jgi:hypothetical protein
MTNSTIPPNDPPSYTESSRSDPSNDCTDSFLSLLERRPPAYTSASEDNLPDNSSLPSYTCTINLTTNFLFKRELDTPSSISPQRKWRRVTAELRGTSLIISSHFRGRSAPLTRNYTLQAADAGLALDYTARSHCLRVRAEGEQFLLATTDAVTVLNWVERFQAAIAISAPVEEREESKVRVVPVLRKKAEPGFREECRRKWREEWCRPKGEWEWLGEKILCPEAQEGFLLPVAPPAAATEGGDERRRSEESSRSDSSLASGTASQRRTNSAAISSTMTRNCSAQQQQQQQQQQQEAPPSTRLIMIISTTSSPDPSRSSSTSSTAATTTTTTTTTGVSQTSIRVRVEAAAAPYQPRPKSTLHFPSSSPAQTSCRQSSSPSSSTSSLSTTSSSSSSLSPQQSQSQSQSPPQPSLSPDDLLYIQCCTRVLRYTSTWRPGKYVKYGKTVPIWEHGTVAGIRRARMGKGY